MIYIILAVVVLAAEGELGKALGRLMMLAESYPDLKANQNFMELQRTLHEVENQIALSGQFYNDTVLKYQNKRQMFPTNMVAVMFGFKEERYFEAGSAERECEGQLLTGRTVAKPSRGGYGIHKGGQGFGVK